MGQVVRLNRPWVGSDAGWRATHAEVERRVRRWRLQRALEAWLWTLPATALAVATEALAAAAARALAGMRAAAGGARP